MTDYIIVGRPTWADLHRSPYDLVLADDTVGVGATVTATLGTADESALINAGVIVRASEGPPWNPALQHIYPR